MRAVYCMCLGLCVHICTCLKTFLWLKPNFKNFILNICILVQSDARLLISAGCARSPAAPLATLRPCLFAHCFFGFVFCLQTVALLQRRLLLCFLLSYSPVFPCTATPHAACPLPGLSWDEGETKDNITTNPTRLCLLPACKAASTEDSRSLDLSYLSLGLSLPMTM